MAKKTKAQEKEEIRDETIRRILKRNRVPVSMLGWVKREMQIEMIKINQVEKKLIPKAKKLAPKAKRKAKGGDKIISKERRENEENVLKLINKNRERKDGIKKLLEKHEISLELLEKINNVSKSHDLTLEKIEEKIVSSDFSIEKFEAISRKNSGPISEKNSSPKQAKKWKTLRVAAFGAVVGLIITMALRPELISGGGDVVSVAIGWAFMFAIVSGIRNLVIRIWNK